MKIILFGAPGSGKGTQAELISRKTGFPAVSTGNMIREAIKNNTESGLAAKQYTDAGKLVPDEAVIDILKERIAKDDCKDGFVLDGFPRTIPQAESLERMGIEIDAVLSLEIDDSEIEGRMTGRRACTDCGATYHMHNKPPKAEDRCDSCGAALVRRPDDDPEILRTRLVNYHNETEPVKEFYRARGKLVTVDGSGTVDSVTQSVASVLGI